MTYKGIKMQQSSLLDNPPNWSIDGRKKLLKTAKEGQFSALGCPTFPDFRCSSFHSDELKRGWQSTDFVFGIQHYLAYTGFLNHSLESPCSHEDFQNYLIPLFGGENAGILSFSPNQHWFWEIVRFMLKHEKRGKDIIPAYKEFYNLDNIGSIESLDRNKVARFLMLGYFVYDWSTSECIVNPLFSIKYEETISESKARAKGLIQHWDKVFG